MTCEVCMRGVTSSFFHQSLHKENRSNKVVQVALGAIILTAITFAILGMTPFMPLRAMAWGIEVSIFSIIALGVFRCCSSIEFDRQWKGTAIIRSDFKDRVMNENDERIGKYGVQVAKLQSENAALKFQLSKKR